MSVRVVSINRQIGHPVLFPATRQALADQLRRVITDAEAAGQQWLVDDLTDALTRLDPHGEARRVGE